MIVSTPYTECYVKKSFLSGDPNYGKDETIFGVLQLLELFRLFIGYALKKVMIKKIHMEKTH